MFYTTFSLVNNILLKFSGPHDMDWNAGILSPQKNKSRLKTPEQVQALEKVYNGMLSIPFQQPMFLCCVNFQI